jgi:hypothetical protein
MAELTPAASSRASRADDRPGITLPLWLTDTRTADMLFVTLVAIAALLLRTIDLGDFPWGMHGDEAWTGLDANVILDGHPGEIWPYTRAALGQPSGPMFWAAPFEWAFGPTVVATRLPMAVAGVLTVVVGFFAMRELFNRPAAYAWAVLAAFSSWLIFYNRTGYTVSFFPLTEMASLLAVALALRRRWWPWYIGAGLIVGAGIYGYFSYPLFAVGLGIYVVLHAIIERPSPFIVHARNVAVMGLAALLAIQPMWSYFFSDEIGYSKDRDVFALSRSEKWQGVETTWDKVGAYAENAQDVARTLMWEGWLDQSDGSGQVPALDWIVIALAAAGLGLSLWLAWKERKAAYLLPWIMLPLIFVGPMWNFSGYHRRSLGLLVFVLMAASIAMAYMWDSGRRRNATTATLAAFVLILLAYGAYNTQKYFDDQRDTVNMIFTYGPELTLMSEWVADQPKDTPIYFFGDRWSINYETPRYLLREHPHKEDRSENFAQPENVGIPELDRSEDALIVLMGRHIEDEDTNVAAAYPDAVRYQGPDVSGRVSFVAYLVRAK